MNNYSDQDSSDKTQESLDNNQGSSDNKIAVFPSGNHQRITEPDRVSFTKNELQTILNLYGRMVARGEWKDYAMDFMRDRAVFSVFRRASEMPLYRVEKNPKLSGKQGAYSVVAVTGLVLRRGNDLARVINVLEKKIDVVRG